MNGQSLGLRHGALALRGPARYNARVIFGAHPALREALDARGYVEPTPVQAAVLAPELAGCDLLVSSRTGSGKTVAFGLVMASSPLGDAPAFPGGAARPSASSSRPRASSRSRSSASWRGWFAETGARVGACVGGMDPRREARALAQGLQLVVGTPGRLRDHLDRQNLTLGGLGAIVLHRGGGEILELRIATRASGPLRAGRKAAGTDPHRGLDGEQRHVRRR
jgi:ATP-dependent RNA helicase DeaD